MFFFFEPLPLLQGQQEYELCESPGTNYFKMHGWSVGDVLIRLTPWRSGNGCGMRQARFRSKYSRQEETAWEGHVKPVMEVAV